MISPGDTWTGAATIALAMAFTTGACEKPPAPSTESAECAAVRDLGKRSLERWVKHNDDAPGPDAPIAAAADHTAKMAATAREIGDAFVKAAPKRKDLAETAEGAKMLGDLAGAKLEAMARTVRELGVKIDAITKIEGAANETVDKLWPDAAKNVGCETTAPPGCGDVIARLGELGGVRPPAGFDQAARAAKARAGVLDALAKAIEALPPAPPKQAARDEAIKNARAGAEGFRALAKVLAEAAAPQDRLPNERQDAIEAAARLTAELEAAAVLCGGKLPPKPAPK